MWKRSVFEYIVLSMVYLLFSREHDVVYMVNGFNIAA
jgi:hypothetical protein